MMFQLKNNAEEFLIKEIDKDKLYNFLREMEFNRLLSQAISFYGEPNKKILTKKINLKSNQKLILKNIKTYLKKKI